MHPIERLRFVARAVGVDDQLLALEATAALMSFADNPAALVAGCRRILARQPGCGPLWWASARMLTAEDLWATAQETLSLLDDDPTEAALAYALGEWDAQGELGAPVEQDPPGRHSGEETVHVPVGITRARAFGAGRVLLAGDRTGSESIAESDDARWLVAGVGTHLSPQMFEALELACSDGGQSHEPLVIVDLERFTHVVGPHGPVPLSALEKSDCPVAPELFTLDG